MMDKRRLWARVRKVWITLGLSATAIFVVWSLIAYRASSEARAAAVSDATVDVRRGDGIISFTPGTGRPSANRALIFFPGALVDPVAYAPLARSAASAGFPAFIVELPRRGAFGGAENPEIRVRLDRILDRHQSHSWLVAGHSRGAVVASQVAGENRKGLAGLIIIGSSHPRDIDLRKLVQPVTKIVGTRDGLASPSEVEANRHLLPASTRWVSVEGGNHSQFGWYGFQPGDRLAKISAHSQRSLMIEAVLDALATTSLPASAASLPSPASSRANFDSSSGHQP